MRKLLLLTTLLLCATAHAADAPELPARFVRIYSLSEMEDGGYYAIGAQDDSTLYFMRQSFSSQVSGKLTTARAGTAEEAFNVTRDDLPWLMEQSGTGWTIQGGGNYLAPDGSNDFQLGTTAAEWLLEDMGDGTFTLTAADDPDARTGVRDRSGTHYFGRYRSTDDRTLLLIYKYDAVQAQRPDDGATAGLGVVKGGSFWAMATGTDSLADASSFYLASDTLAPDGDFTRLTAHYADTDTFRLLTDGGEWLCTTGGQLATTTDTTATATRWYVESGRLMAMQDDGTALVLCAEETDGKLAARLCTAEAFGSSKLATMLFKPVGPEPSADTSDEGVATLQGAWSARQLASLPTDGLTAVDMTAISLPREAGALTVENPNMLVYVRSEESQYVPDSWEMVVAVGEEGNAALRAIELTDRMPFYTPRPFTAEQGISYTRSLHADGGWETLCLPFDIQLLPEGFVFETCQSLEGNAIQCAQTRSLAANVPVIFIPDETGADSTTLTLTAGNVTVDTRNADESTLLRANYADLTVGDLTAPCYLLEETGAEFVYADATSYLPPFRAYLTDGNSGLSIRLVHAQATAIQTTTASRTPSACYGLDGRRIADTTRQVGRIIIRNGKKIIQ